MMKKSLLILATELPTKYTNTIYERIGVDFAIFLDGEKNMTIGYLPDEVVGVYSPPMLAIVNMIAFMGNTLKELNYISVLSNSEFLATWWPWWKKKLLEKAYSSAQAKKSSNGELIEKIYLERTIKGHKQKFEIQFVSSLTLKKVYAEAAGARIDKKSSHRR